VTNLDRFLHPTVALGAGALVLHIGVGFAPHVDVNCKACERSRRAAPKRTCPTHRS
jgi:hypothetical protein